MCTKSSGGMGEEIRGNPCLGLKRHACASSERGRDETEYIIQTSVIDAALLTIKQTISYGMKATNSSLHDFCLAFQPRATRSIFKSEIWLPIEPSIRNTLKRRLKKSVREGGKHPGCPCLVS